MADNIKGFNSLRDALTLKDEYSYVIIGERKGDRGNFSPKRMPVGKFIERIIEQGLGGHGGAGIEYVADIAERDALDTSPGTTAYVADASADLGKTLWGMYTWTGTEWSLIATQDDVTYDSIFDDSLAVPTTIGGIDAGTTVGDLRGLSPTEMFDAILFPTIPPSSSPKSVVLSGITGGNYEVGTQVITSLTATFNQGTITNGDASPGPALVGQGNNYTYKDPDGVTIGSNATAGNIDAINAPLYIITIGNNIWNVVTDHDAGTGLYYDSKGIASTDLDTQRVAGSTADNSSNMSGRYYAWRGSGPGGSAPTNSAQVRAETDKSFLSTSNTGSFNITIPPGTQEVFISIPAGKTLTVLYVESSNADVTGSFTSNAFNVDDANANPVAYETFVSFIGVGGYPATATYAVTIS
jgi:hypothetical protein